MIFKDSRHYDLLKTIALLVLPIGTFISTFCTIWIDPAIAEKIMQTFAALDVLCGAIVAISNSAYKRQGNG